MEPDNAALRNRESDVQALLARQTPSLPSTLAQEKLTNPFLRCDQPQVRKAAEHHAGKRLPDPAAVFAALRAWKDDF